MFLKAGVSVQSMRPAMATLLEVREIMNKMPTKYSTDGFELNMFFLKKLECIIVPIVTNLINKCIDERSFPTCLKEAVIVAVYKSGDVRNHLTSEQFLFFRPLQKPLKYSCKTKYLIFSKFLISCTQINMFSDDTEEQLVL